MNESRLLYEIMHELGKHGSIFRTNSGNIKLPSGKIFHGLPEGFSDLLFVRPDGKVYFVELKIEKGKLFNEQERFIRHMQSLNARAGVARSVGEALVICGIKEAFQNE